MFEELRGSTRLDMEYERRVYGKRGSRKREPKAENCYVHWKKMRKVARKVEKDRGMKGKGGGFKKEGWAQNVELSRQMLHVPKICIPLLLSGIFYKFQTNQVSW